MSQTQGAAQDVEARDVEAQEPELQPVTQDPMTQVAARTRTYSWDDPMTGLSSLIGLSGLAQIQSMIDGRVPPPPVMRLIDAERMEAEFGKVVVTMRAQEFHYNPLGTVHGGVLATLLDTAAACAVHTTLEAGYLYTTLDLTSKYLRPVTMDSGMLRCVGTVVSRGRRTALAQAHLTDEKDRLVAHATSSCLIFLMGE